MLHGLMTTGLCFVGTWALMTLIGPHVDRAIESIDSIFGSSRLRN